MNAKSFGRMAGRVAHATERVAKAVGEGFEKADNFARDVYDGASEYVTDPAGLRHDAHEVQKEVQGWVDETAQQFQIAAFAMVVAIIAAAIPTQEISSSTTALLWAQWGVIVVLGLVAASALLKAALAYRALRVATLGALIADRVAKSGTISDRIARVFTTFAFAPAFFALALTGYLLIVPFRHNPYAALIALLAVATTILVALWNPKVRWAYKIPTLLFVIATILPFVSWGGSAIQRQVAIKENATVAATVAREQRQQAARAQTIAAQEGIEGTWSVVGGAGSPVYVGDYTIDPSGSLTKFQLEFSFVGSNNIAYSNNWNCSRVVQSTNRYNCTYTQRWDGGSIKEPASLTRINSSTFSGRYMHNNLWKEITFQKQG